MRLVVLLLCGLFLAAGCATGPPATRSVDYGVDAPDVIEATPVTHAGRVMMVNNAARFTVLNFPVGSVPGADQRLNVYREGLKVAELRVTGPQRDNNTVADIIAGEARVNDEVRPD